MKEQTSNDISTLISNLSMELVSNLPDSYKVKRAKETVSEIANLLSKKK